MKYILISLLFALNVQAREIKIAILDSGVSQLAGVHFCKDGLVDFTNTSVDAEFDGHGTNVTHIISDSLPYNSYCIYELKIFTEKSKFKNYTPQAILFAISHKVDIINYSAEGGEDSYSIEAQVIALAIKRGIKVIAAAGNEGHNLDKTCDSFIACYPGVISVGNKNNKTSNYGKRITTWRNGNDIKAGGTIKSGTSQACALTTKDYALKLIKEQK